MAAGDSVSRVALNLLLISLGGLMQFPTDDEVVGTRDGKLFPFAGMLPQLKGLGVVLAGSCDLFETVVVVPYRPICEREIRIKLDGALMVRQGCGETFLIPGLYSRAIRFERFQRRGGSLR